ncbi:UNVERIFIED_CONTAM: tRNA-dihydrouridine(20/20a) synthase [Sesamum calycinum]|uniref:tRNA-dihydrouridine(20/20a) synthase n=1 Tax=Sesamum calycinum TaxID=2727403 RepID=A0AAW2T099_9LAMI
MMKSAGHTLFASLTPVRSVILKNHGRFSSNFIYRYPAKSRKLHHYHHKCQSHKESIMVATRIAPMMDYTDNHFRTLARLISKHAWLYTEMIAAETIVYQKGNLDRFLAFGPEQHPIVLQIGGSDLENIAKATQLANSYGYDEINFNCGCPSPKVAGKGCFGVRLMLDPKFVADAMSVISANTDVPVSVKCRIGVDDHDSYNELYCGHKYEYYYALVRDFPDLQFTINGGINTIDEVNTAIREGAHGVMVGRAAYNNSWNLLGHVDSAIYGAPLSSLTRRQVLEKYQEYGDSVLGLYGPKPNVRDLIKPLLGFFHSEPGNGLWKRKADAAFLHCTTIKSFFEETLVAIPDSVLDSPITAAPIGFTDVFADAKRLLPPPHTVREEELLYA